MVPITPNVNDNALLTLEEIIKSLPDELQEVARTWGPTIFDMGAHEVQAWVNLMLLGDYATAYATLLKRKGSAEIISMWTSLDMKWKEINLNNAEKIKAQRSIIMDILKACFSIGLALLPAGL